MAIYGADIVGARLARSLAISHEYEPVVFVDDDPRFLGTTISGLEVLPSHRLQTLMQKLKVETVLISFQNVTEQSRVEILKLISRNPVKIKVVKSIDEFENDIHPVLADLELDELLGRKTVPPSPELLSRAINEKVVLVSGGGGSIGSELSRQIFALHPKKLILVDISEFALYSIHSALTSSSNTQVEVIPILGSVNDEELMRYDQFWCPNGISCGRV